MNQHGLSSPTLDIKELILVYEKSLPVNDDGGSGGLDGGKQQQLQDSGHHRLLRKSSVEGSSARGMTQLAPKSPGRKLMRKAMKTFNKTLKKRGNKDDEEDSNVEVDVTPLSVEARFDIAMRSIAEERNKMAATKVDSATADTVDDGDRRATTTSHVPVPASSVVELTEKQKKMKELRGSSLSRSKRGSSSDNGKSIKTNKVTTDQEADGDDLAHNFENDQRRLSRRLSRRKGVSPGTLKRIPSRAAGDDRIDETEEELVGGEKAPVADDQKTSRASLSRKSRREEKVKNPSRSLSAGPLDVPSSYPPEEPETKQHEGKRQDRYTRSASLNRLQRTRTNRSGGRRKDLLTSSLHGDEKEDDAGPDRGMEDSQRDAKVTTTITSPTRSPNRAALRRLRGRSPGSLREMRKIAHLDLMEKAADERDDPATVFGSVPPPPPSRQLSVSRHRGRSPRTIRKTSNMTGEVTNDQSTEAPEGKGGMEGNRSRSPQKSRHGRPDGNTTSRSPHSSVHSRHRPAAGRAGTSDEIGDVHFVPDVHSPTADRRVGTNSERRRRTGYDSSPHHHNSHLSSSGEVSTVSPGKLESPAPKRSSSKHRPPPTVEETTTTAAQTSSNDTDQTAEDSDIQLLKHRSPSLKSRRPTKSHRPQQARKVQSLIVQR